MSLQWVAVAGFLYVEIGLTLLMVLPILKPSRWKWIFSMRIFSAMKSVWQTAFYAILLILVVLFFDAIRTMTKYKEDLASLTLDAKIDRHLKECRGQRNFYITGFALFLIFVIYRLIVLLSQRANLEADNDALRKQAESASRMALQNLSSTDKGSKPKTKEPSKDKVVEEEEEEEKEEEEKPSNEEFKALEEELRMAKMDLLAMKEQATSTNREYDRLNEECKSLQNRLAQLEGNEESRKDL